MGPMAWSTEDWQAALAAPDWGRNVADTLRRYFDEGRWLLEPHSWLT